jgi:5-formyltetrahydrofolate cyclo-ligase
MAVPRLASAKPFLVLDPAALDVSPRAASSIKGSGQHGRPAAVADLEPVDLVVTGCVAVDRSGARLGKGGGFADLEFAVAAAAGLVAPSTVVATTVHPSQLVEADRIPVTPHDVRLDLVVTPDEVIVCEGPQRRPAGVRWDELSDTKIAAIPLLAELAAGR